MFTITSITVTSFPTCRVLGNKTCLSHLGQMPKRAVLHRQCLLRPHRSKSAARKNSVAKTTQQQQQQQTQLNSKKPCNPQADSKNVNATSSLGRDDASLSRYPNITSPGGILRGLDYVGTVTFALTGSVTAAQSGLDVFGCCMVGMVTGVGGGSIRDAVFLARRPFWTFETEYIWMTIATAFVTFFAWPSVMEWQEEHRQKRINQGEKSDDVQYDTVDLALDTFDAIGLSAFAIIGAQNGIRAGTSMLVSGICGMTTSTFGGLTRDVLCGRPVRIVHSNAEIYAQPALAGASIYLMAHRFGAAPMTRIGLGMVTCMGSRFLAVQQDVKLHTWDTKNDGLGVAVRK